MTSPTPRAGSRSVWVVLPTYNEAGNVERLLAALRSPGLDLAVLVVDDASPDGTGAIVERIAAGDPEVRLLRRTGPRGLGVAYRDGLVAALAAGADRLVTMDADFSHDPSAIPGLLAALERGEVAVGSRYVPGGCVLDWNAERRFLSRQANRFARWLLRMPVADATSGFRAFRREALLEIPWERIHSSGYSFVVELLWRVLRREELRAVEVPIRFVDRQVGRSKMGAREVFVGMTQLIRLRLRGR